jgi:hypothetical protein
MSSEKIWTMDLYEKIEKIEADEDADSDQEFKSVIQIITGGSDSTLKVWKDYTA